MSWVKLHGGTLPELRSKGNEILVVFPEKIVFRIFGDVEFDQGNR